ncbi:MAG TPA: hypothetical protein VH309_09845, partial [Elusimicrobiota bacterium]|nr:hypothetical protein [Elusimicrobiota bacterium]
FVGLIISYQAAAAFHADDPRLCDGLKVRGGDVQGMSRACRREAIEMLALRDLVSGGAEYRKVCVQMEMTGSKPRDKKTCSLISSNIGDPTRLCELLIENKSLLPLQREACVFNFSAYTRFQEPDYCEVPELPAQSLRSCRDVTAYARAYRAGRADVCGDSRRCRMMADKDALRTSYEELKTLACLKR